MALQYIPLVIPPRGLRQKDLHKFGDSETCTADCFCPGSSVIVFQPPALQKALLCEHGLLDPEAILSGAFVAISGYPPLTLTPNAWRPGTVRNSSPAAAAAAAPRVRRPGWRWPGVPAAAAGKSGRPQEHAEIADASSRQQIPKLTEDGLIIRKPVTARSRARRGTVTLAPRKAGTGASGGGAREKVARPRGLPRRCRASRKIDPHTYHSLYLELKGSVFKNKRILVEHIRKMKGTRPARAPADQADARRSEPKGARRRRRQRP
ncbi:60S ribosomal protein L19-like [Octodon degus]|uniref:Large ribosomal subunit protein eL19 n=1 Tax=Octodon degus TaxID=10160 RepID=A0A6P6EH53_OCTDE|nr:60S ribosomal protein L19-like [Octodon degus]